MDDWQILHGLPDSSLGYHTYIGSGARPASYPMDTGGSFPEGEAVEREPDIYFHLVCQILHVGHYISTLHCVSRARCSIAYGEDF